MPRGINVYDEARLQGRLWVPLLLRGTNKITRWYKLTEGGVTCDGSSLASNVRDFSGNGSDATQVTSGNRPTYEAASSVHRGRPALVCPGSSKILDLSTVAYNGTNGLSWAIVASQNASGDNCLVAGTVGGLEIRFNGGTTSFEVLRQAQASLITTASGTCPLDTPHVVGCDLATNSTMAWVNGASSSNSTNPNLSTGGISLLSAGGEFLRGRFCEAVVSESKWTPRERYLVDGYLSWLHRIPLSASHPFASRPPLIGD